jgi:HAD superfamily hydrolase (TIGR01490 family)
LPLAIFDLDHTLLDGDTDYLWHSHLCDQGVIDRATFLRRYHEQNSAYDGGTLDPGEYVRALVDALAHLSTAQLNQLLMTFTKEVVPHHVAPAALELLQYHRDRGDYLLIITATVEFLARCSIAPLPIDDFIATELEWHNDRPTGVLRGPASFRHGKVTRLHEWIAGRNHSLSESWFYSDSINDLPMLELVDNPVTVNADASLQAIAARRNWPQMTIRRDADRSSLG